MNYVWHGHHDEIFKNIDITRIFFICAQIICWGISAYFLRFELMRGLGHVWYMHHLFVWLSSVVYIIDTVYTIVDWEEEWKL